MAQTRLIQDLVELITPNNNDVFVVVDNTTNPSLSVTKKISYASLKEDLQDMINVLTSGGTGINASYNDAGNVLTLSVVDDTTTQRTIISSGGTTIGTRQKLNFIKGSGISFVGADNAGDNRVDLTVAVVPNGTAMPEMVRGASPAAASRLTEVAVNFIMVRIPQSLVQQQCQRFRPLLFSQMLQCQIQRVCL